MKISRRRLAGVLVAPALAAQSQAPQPIPRSPDEELAATRDLNRRAFEALDQVKLPVETEPAFQFKA